MRSTFHGLEVAKRGLYAQQTAIATAGHNITNANTPGYSRQRVNFSAAAAIDVPGLNRTYTPGQLGTGVTFSSIERMRERFLDDQFRYEAGSYGAWNVQKDVLEKLELIFGEPGETGMSSVIDAFWNAWQELSREPENLEARAVVKERSQALLDVFQHADRKLTELKDDLSTNLDLKLTQANTYIQQIAQLNGEIRRIENVGDQANDLMDQRDLLVDKLAELVQIDVKIGSDGLYEIALVNADGSAGQVLVDENGPQFFQTTTDNTGTIDPLNTVTGGEIYGIIHSRDTLVAAYQEQLNAMFAGIIFGEVTVNIPAGSVLPVDVEDVDGHTYPAETAVPDGGIKVVVNGINGLLQLGWTVRENANGDAQQGVPLFDGFDENNFSIQDVQLNDQIAHDLGMIAASFRIDDEGNVLKGNGDLALAIAQLRDGEFQFGDEMSGTFDEYFRAVLGQLGVQTQEATRQTNNQKVILNAVDQRRMSVSGVSLDEEMTNLIQFQHAYNAAARMMTTLDQMFETIINRMGVVGR